MSASPPHRNKNRPARGASAGSELSHGSGAGRSFCDERSFSSNATDTSAWHEETHLHLGLCVDATASHTFKAIRFPAFSGPLELLGDSKLCKFILSLRCSYQAACLNVPLFLAIPVSISSFLKCCPIQVSSNNSTLEPASGSH